MNTLGTWSVLVGNVISTFTIYLLLSFYFRLDRSPSFFVV